jgi:hypothetical protein
MVARDHDDTYSGLATFADGLGHSRTNRVGQADEAEELEIEAVLGRGEVG